MWKYEVTTVYRWELILVWFSDIWSGVSDKVRRKNRAEESGCWVLQRQRRGKFQKRKLWSAVLLDGTLCIFTSKILMIMLIVIGIILEMRVKINNLRQPWTRSQKNWILATKYLAALGQIISLWSSAVYIIQEDLAS